MTHPTLPAKRILALLILTVPLVAGLAHLRAGYDVVQVDMVAAHELAQPPCVDSGRGLFNDCAVLDTSRIDDLRTSAEKTEGRLFVAEDGHLVAADAN